MKLFYIKKYKFAHEIILFVNIFLLFSNIFFYNKIIIPQLSQKLLKFSDYFIFNLNSKTYNEASKYLTNKYYINNYSYLKSNVFKKEIKIKTIGLFDKSIQENWLKSKLSDEFTIKFDEDNPDYLIYNVFTYEDISNKYRKSIKIAIYTENVMPDLNLADYVIAPYHIIYLDRCFKYSIFLKYFAGIAKKRKNLIKNPLRKKFCAAVISNCYFEFSYFRINFIKKLNEYKKIDMGGKCENNINRTVKNKIEFLSSYKFSIAMENSNGDGYFSEKIIDSFLAGTIPIYYGDYTLDEFINPKSYILIKGEKDISKKIEYIKKIDNDDNLYLAILKENPIFDDNFISKIDKFEIKAFLKNIFQQDKNTAFRKDDYYTDLRDNYIFLQLNLKFLFILLFLL